MLSILVAAVIAVVISTALTPVVRRYARWAGAVDTLGGRRVHAVATARMGGAAVFAAYVIGLGATMAKVEGASPHGPVSRVARGGADETSGSLRADVP